MTGKWDCDGLKLSIFQDGCSATTSYEDIKMEVIGNYVTNTGTQFNGVNFTVNESQTEMTSSEHLCKKETGNYVNTTEMPGFSAKNYFVIS